MRNPKTTITGILTIIAAVSNALLGFLNGSPIDYAATVTAVMAGIGLITAADGGK